MYKSRSCPEYDGTNAIKMSQIYLTWLEHPSAAHHMWRHNNTAKVNARRLRDNLRTLPIVQRTMLLKFCREFIAVYGADNIITPIRKPIRRRYPNAVVREVPAEDDRRNGWYFKEQYS